MRTTLLITAATSIFYSISAVPVVFQSEEVSRTLPRFIHVKRIGSIQAGPILKRDLAATLAADQAQVLADNAVVATDTTNQANAAMKDTAANAAFSSSKSASNYYDPITASLLIASTTAATQALSDQTAWNLAKTTASSFDATSAAGDLMYGQAVSHSNTVQITFNAAERALTNALPSPPLTDFTLDTWTSSLLQYQDLYNNVDTVAKATFATSMATVNGQIRSALSAHPELTAYATAYTADLTAFNMYSSAKSAEAAALTTAASGENAAAPYDTAVTDALAKYQLSSQAARTALTAYNAALADSTGVDAVLRTNTGLKATADGVLAGTLATLTADTATDNADKAKVVADQAAITLANAPKTLADAADALAVSTLTTTSVALTALNLAQATLKTDTASSASAIQVLQSPLDAVSNFLALATIAFTNAATAATLAVTNQATSQAAYNNALAQSTKSTKTYNDALNAANAMIHGGAKNAAITATTSLKTASVSDTILTATAAFNLALAKQANLAAIATVTGTTTALAFETAKFKIANDKMAMAKSRIAADTAALTTLTTTYNSAKAASDLAAVKKTAADLAYKCSLGPC